MPPVPWHKPPRRPRADRVPLTRERIVAAGLKIADAEGLDAMSTRRVAEALGTGSASLYAHVTSRDELIELMVDHVAGEISVPPPDPARWQQQLREYAHQAQRVWAAHADLALASLSTLPTGPGRLAVIEGLLAVLRAAGFGAQQAVWAVDRLQDYIDADAFEGWLHVVGSRRGSEPEGHLDAARDYFRQLPPGQFPHITALADELVAGGGEQRFDFGLDLLLAGLAACRPG